YGGDEIVVILENVGVKRAQEIAERIYNTIASIRIENCPAEITVSIGISIYPVDGRTASDLVSAADEAMYKAKWSRSRIFFASKK
ncbi:MAG: sensor domain-containing diguanylate cyclase, partial [Thermotoga sp.]